MSKVDIPIAGMDCAECTLHVQHAIAALPGVQSVNVFLAAEKATLRFDPAVLDLAAVSRAVADAGYRVPERGLPQPVAAPMTDFGRRMAGAVCADHGARAVAGRAGAGDRGRLPDFP